MTLFRLLNHTEECHFMCEKQVENELDRLQQLDIIEDVKGPTPWVSPIVTAAKPKCPNQIRICVDMRSANKAVKHERHVTPTIENLLSDLNGAKLFSKCDLNKGCDQLELALDLLPLFLLTWV